MNTPVGGTGAFTRPARLDPRGVAPARLASPARLDHAGTVPVLCRRVGLLLSGRSVAPDDPLAFGLQTLPGVTPARLELLGRLGLRTVGDLLFHFPRAYEDLSDVRPIAGLAAGSIQTVQGE